MKIKSILLATMMLCSTATFTVNAATADAGNNKATVKERVAGMTEEQKKARILQMQARVNEIKAMDKSQLSSAERKALRQELRSMKKEARYLDSSDVAIVLMGGFLFSMFLVLLLA